jgi:hypothetical protein
MSFWNQVVIHRPARTALRWKPKGRFMMNHSIWLLFAIPILCIIVVAFAQFGDEMFKKKFIIERRTAKDKNSDLRRRYSDPREPVGQSEIDSSSATDASVLETSGNRL